MTDQQQETLRKIFETIDKGLAALRDATADLDAARDELLDKHGADLSGTCEDCGRPLFPGDLGFRYDDGPTLCEAHAPTWDELKREQDELIAQGIFEDCFEDGPEAAEGARQQVLDQIAAGDGNKRRTYKL